MCQMETPIQDYCRKSNEIRDGYNKNVKRNL